MMLKAGRGWPDRADEAMRQAVTRPLHEAASVIAFPTAKTETPLPSKRGKPAARAKGPAHHYLAANEKTVHWGYFSKSQPPIFAVASRDIVTIETLTHHGYDDYERMIKGDTDAESIFRWTKDDKTINRRGAGPRWTPLGPAE